MEKLWIQEEDPLQGELLNTDTWEITIGSGMFQPVLPSPSDLHTGKQRGLQQPTRKAFVPKNSFCAVLFIAAKKKIP